MTILGYSFTDRAIRNSPSSLDGEAPAGTTVGAADGRWYWMHLTVPAKPTSDFRFNALGIIRVRFAGWIDLIAVHMAWTIAPNALLLAWPLRAMWRERRRLWRTRNGLCGECGYDVRAAETRCPECGIVLDEEHLSALSAIEQRRHAETEPPPT